MTERTVAVTLAMKVRQYVSGADQAIAANKRLGASSKALATELDKAAKAGKLDDVADAAGRAGLALTGAFALTVAAAARFEKAMSGAAAATQANAKNLSALRDAALQAGKTTKFSATQAATAITELGKAGVSTSAILGGGLKGALSLAAAGQLDVGEAAETAASAMGQFKLKGADVSHVADLLAAAAGKAQGTVHDMGYALAQSGLVAHQFGISVEDTTGTLAAFANAGLIGSDAGTSFKTMLIALAKPSEESAKALKKVGVNAYDAQGAFVGVTNLAGQLQDRLGGLTQEQRNAALAQIFGNDALRAASVLYEQGAQGIQEWISKTNEQGFAAKTAAKLTDNLVGDIERLKSSLETMAIESGSGANSGLRVLTKSADALVEQFASLPPVVGSTVTVLAGLSGGLLLAGAGWVKMRRSNAEALTELRATGPAGTKAATALQGTAKWAGRAGAAFVALEVGAAAASAAFGHSLDPKLDALGTGLQGFAAGGTVAGETARLFGGDLGKLDAALTDVAQTGKWSSFTRGAEGFIESVTGSGQLLDDSLAHSRERLAALDGALTQLTQGGHGEQAAKIFAVIAERAKEQGVSVNELKRVLPGYAAATEVAGKATGDTAAAIEGAGGAADKAAEEVKKLNDAFDALFNVAISGDRLQIALADSIKAVNKELTHGTRTLSLDTEEGKKNRTALLDRIELLKQSRDQQVAQGGATEAAIARANAAFASNVTALRKSALVAGFSETAVDKLLGKYREMPKDVSTLVKTPGLTTAKTAIEDYQTQIDDVARHIRTDITCQGLPAAEAQLAGLLVKQKALKEGISIPVAQARYNKQRRIAMQWASGGPVWGAGTETSDDVPAWLSNGEWVIRAKSAKKLGSQKMAYINKYGELPSFAGGGTLHAPFPVSAAMTKIPSLAEVSKAVAGALAGPIGSWPSSPGSQRGDSGVWHNILALVKNSGIPYQFGNAYRPGDPKWHGSGRAIDFTGYNQDALANFFVKMRPKVLELIHRTKYGDYGISRGQFHAMPTQWPLHENHLHVAMRNGGVIREPVFGVGRSGATYSFGEGGRAEAVTPLGMANGGLVNVARTPVDARGSRMDTQEAYISARDAVVSLNAALKQNGATLSVNTSKGRANRSELISGVRAAQSAAEAKFDETGSVRLANVAYDEHIRRLRRVLAQQKVSAATIRLLMRELATAPQYDRPDKVLPNSLTNVAFAKSSAGVQEDFAKLRDTLSLNLPTTANTSAEGRENLLGIIGFLESAAGAAQDRFTQTGSSKTAKALYTHYVAALKKALASAGFSKAAAAALIGTYGRVTLQPNAAGGVYGGLSQAATMPAGKTLWQWREPSTGGEAFIPRNGQRERSERALQVAAGWYGGQYSSPTAGAGSGGGYQSHMTVNNYGERMTLAQYNQARRQAAVRARVGRNS